MNISVPADLKREMDRVKDEANWSAVAAEAFRNKLLHLRAERKATTMEDVIARMKAAAELEANESYQAGRDAGQSWVKASATPRQLKRLSRTIEDYGNAAEFTGGQPMAPHSNAGWLAIAVEGEGCDPEAFWEQALGNDAARAEEEDFLHGFIEGVLDTWNQIESQI